MDRVVPASGGTDRPRRADVLGPGGQGVVGALAVHLADRVDGRHVDHVEAHVRDARQRGGRRREGAVHRPALGVAPTGRAGEQLVPGADQRPLAVHPHPVGLPARHQVANRVGRQELGHLLGQRRSHPLGHPGVGAQRGGGGRQHGPARLGARRGGAVEQPGADLEVVGQLARTLADAELGRDGVPPGGDGVAPRVDPEGPHARPVGGDQRVEAVGFLTGRHRHGGRPGPGTGTAPDERGGDRVVALPPHGRGDGQHLADHQLRRVGAPGHHRCHVVDAEPSAHACTLRPARRRGHVTGAPLGAPAPSLDHHPAVIVRATPGEGGLAARRHLNRSRSR